MNIKLASNNFYASFSNFLPINGVYSPGDEVDLLIFPGGEDINPALYNQAPNGAVGWNDKRDAQEMMALRDFISGVEGRSPRRIKKVLGVCRGLQLMAAGFGGSLLQHVRQPGATHGLVWIEPHPLSFMTDTNSLHHQAVNEPGKLWNYGGMILAVEPTYDTVEAVSWGDVAIGVQFHPEFFDKELGNRFFDVIISWANKREMNLYRPPRITADRITLDLEKYQAGAYRVTLDASTRKEQF